MDFNAPRLLAFVAFTRRQLVHRWLSGPPCWNMLQWEFDLHVGGACRWGWRSEKDGAQMAMGTG